MANILKVRIIGVLVSMTAIYGCSGNSAHSSAEIGQPREPDKLMQCNVVLVHRWIGHEVTAKTETEILKDSGADVARLIRPGEAITMDYRTDRINLELNQRGYLVRAYCG